MIHLLAPGFNTNPTAVPGLNKLQVVIGYLAWGASAVALIGVIVAGARLALEYSQGGGGGYGRLGKVIGGLLLISGAGAIAGGLLGFNLFTSAPQAVPGLTQVQTIISYVAWLAAAACVAGIIIAGIKMVISHRHGDDEAMGRLGQIAVGCLVVGSAATIVGAVM